MAIFGSPASEAEVAQAVRIAFDIDAEQVEHGLVVPDVGEALVRVLAYAHGWTLVRVDDRGPMIRPTAP